MSKIIIHENPSGLDGANPVQCVACSFQANVSTVWCGFAPIQAFAHRLKQRRDAALRVKSAVDATLSNRGRTLLETLYQHRRDWQALHLKVQAQSETPHEAITTSWTDGFGQVNTRIAEAEKWLSRAKTVLDQMQDGSNGTAQRIRLLKQDVEQCADAEPQHTMVDNAVVETLETRLARC